jgi:hypothetical protein
MAFQYAEADINGIIDSGTMTTLSPGPTYIEYPDTRFINTTHVSRDGNPVVQAALKDGRIRSWVWARYRPTVPRYDELFEEILQLQAKLRTNEDPVKSEWVFLKEDVTENFGKLNFSGGIWSYVADYMRVKVIDVTQNVASEGGIVRYDITRLTFVIDDDNFNIY